MNDTRPRDAQQKPALPCFSWRALISLTLAVSALVMIVSGVVLFVAPCTRMANETGWKLWGLDKPGWVDLHLVFCALFVVAASAHFVFNWRPFLCHLGWPVAQRLRFRYEWLAALVVAALVFAAARTNTPPVSWLTEWRSSFQCEGARHRKGPTRADRGGFGQKTLAQYCKEQGINLETALQQLRNAGLRAQPTQTLRQIADENGLARPSDIARLLQTR